MNTLITPHASSPLASLKINHAASRAVKQSELLQVIRFVAIRVLFQHKERETWKRPNYPLSL